MSKTNSGRPVQIVSISFPKDKTEKILEIVEQEAKEQPDLIVLPETWKGLSADPERVDGMTVSAVSKLAKKYKTYIICPIFRKEEKSDRINSAVLLNREGEVAFVFDKTYPYWGEFDLQPPTRPGGGAAVFETDFGRIGVAICFDANFPEVWKSLANQGAELVLWPSAYSAGTSLQAHAINHQYYIVSATLVSDCVVYDITGRELLYEKSKEINVSRITLDLDRGIYHENFNMEKRDKLLAEKANSIIQELHMTREEWFVLKAIQPRVSARETAKEYGMEELRDYKNRSRTEIDKMRGTSL